MNGARCLNWDWECVYVVVILVEDMWQHLFRVEESCISETAGHCVQPVSQVLTHWWCSMYTTNMRVTLQRAFIYKLAKAAEICEVGACCATDGCCFVSQWTEISVRTLNSQGVLSRHDRQSPFNLKSNWSFIISVNSLIVFISFHMFDFKAHASKSVWFANINMDFDSFSEPAEYRH